MSHVRPVETVDEECFTAAAPCKTEALLGSIARGAIVEGKAEDVIEEQAPEGVAVMDGVIDAG
jgi:hypothetical protein